MSDPLLHIKDMHVHYGAIHAIHGINLDVFEGEIVTILGSNGAGKTTTLHAISGLLPISSGEIIFDGHPLHTMAANKIVAQGVSQSPEGRMVFPNLTVKENLEMGAYLMRDFAQIEKGEQVEVLVFTRLKEREVQLGCNL